MSMSLPRDTLLKFPGRVFVETGTNSGDGVALALQCGFERVVSIELSDHYFALATARFADDPRVTILHGDSGAVLAQAIADFREPLTFWLDGHTTPGMSLTAQAPCPILQELKAIAAHAIKTHTILVDDVRCFSTPVLDDISVAEIEAAVRAINPAYRITYERGTTDGDVLAAVVPQKES